MEFIDDVSTVMDGAVTVREERVISHCVHEVTSYLMSTDL